MVNQNNMMYFVRHHYHMDAFATWCSHIEFFVFFDKSFLDNWIISYHQFLHGQVPIGMVMRLLGSVLRRRQLTRRKRYLFMGLPKSGTSTIHGFFKCGGISSSHYRCPSKSSPCGICIRENLLAGRDPLQTCGNFTAFTQLDRFNLDPKQSFFPQVHAIEKIRSYYPNSTFILNIRPVHDWVRSVQSWNDLQYRMQRTLGWPDGNLSEILEMFYLNHSKFIKNFAQVPWAQVGGPWYHTHKMRR